MIDLDVFQKGMRALCTAFNREWSDELSDVFLGVLGEKLTTDQFRAAVARALAEEQRFPAPAVLLRPSAERAVALAAEATIAWQRLLRSGCVSGGRTIYRERDVRTALGDEAAQAFLAAGGDDTFTDMQEKDVPFVRGAFIRAYTALVRANPTKAIPVTPALPAARMRALKGGKDS